jgi:hypothetical protein
MQVGTYRLLHVPTGAAYVGASRRCIGNRYSVHLTQLRKGQHHCKRLQILWDTSEPTDWSFEILSTDVPTKEYEAACIAQQADALNSQPMDGTFTHTAEAREKMRAGREKYLESPEARAILQKNALDQHKSGKLGRSTWKEGSDSYFKTDENRERTRVMAAELQKKGKFGPESWKVCEKTGKRGVAAFWARMTPEERSERNRKSAEARKKKLALQANRSLP